MRLVSHYPEAGHTGATLKSICTDYFDDLTEDRTSAEEFAAVVRMARRRCQFFPKVSDLIKLRDEVRANPICKPVAGLIEEESLVKTPEMIESGKRNCKLIALMLKYGIGHTEAGEMLIKEETEKQP